MKAKDAPVTGTVRLILAALKDRDIAARSTGNTNGIGEPEIMSMLQSMIKQRQESMDMYTKAARQDLADKEKQEIDIIMRFLPAQMDEAKIKETVDGLIKELGVADIRDMGKVMAALKTRYTGQLDMARASGMIKERLSA